MTGRPDRGHGSVASIELKAAATPPCGDSLVAVPMRAPWEDA